MKKVISVVLPCLNESKNLKAIIPAIIRSLPRKYNYEIICVDDGSTDRSREVLASLCSKNKKIKAIFFHRNFGHQQALRAGINRARGHAVVTLDADFQHPPTLIPAFIEHWEQGADLVRGQKKEDDTTNLTMKIKRLVGYQIWRVVTNGLIPPGVSDFRLIDKSLVIYLQGSHESEIFLRGLFTLPAKNIITFPYKVEKRRHGHSKYTAKMFFNMFLNGLVSFSIKPLRAGWFLGLILFFGTGAYLLFDIILALMNNRPIIEGFKTLTILTFGLNAIILIYLGLMAEYIGIIFREVKNRPHYLIDQELNFNKK